MGPATECPRCGKPDITGESFEIEGGKVTQEVYCECCQFQWTEVWMWHSSSHDDLKEVSR